MEPRWRISMKAFWLVTVKHIWIKYKRIIVFTFTVKHSLSTFIFTGFSFFSFSPSLITPRLRLQWNKFKRFLQKQEKLKYWFRETCQICGMSWPHPLVSPSQGLQRHVLAWACTEQIYFLQLNKTLLDFCRADICCSLTFIFCTGCTEQWQSMVKVD